MSTRYLTFKERITMPDLTRSEVLRIEEVIREYFYTNPIGKIDDLGIFISRLSAIEQDIQMEMMNDPKPQETSNATVS